MLAHRTLDRSFWQDTLARQESIKGYRDGFKLLFCPWKLIDTADTAFISLNPGNDPSGEHMRIASDERGNSYLVKRSVKHSPIAAQFEHLCAFIGRDPEEVLTGTLMPFRTARWDNRRDKPNIAVAEPFWQTVLGSGRIKQVYCMGKQVEEAVVRMKSARLDREIPANWGDLTIRSHVAPDGTRIYGLLHLSTFKMFGRPACVEQLEKLIVPHKAA